MNDSSESSPHGRARKLDWRKILMSDLSNRMSGHGRGYNTNVSLTQFKSLGSHDRSSMPASYLSRTPPLLISRTINRSVRADSVFSDTRSESSVDDVDSALSDLPPYRRPRRVSETAPHAQLSQQQITTQVLLARVNYLVNVVNFLKHQNLQRKLTEMGTKLTYSQQIVLTQREELEAVRNELAREKELSARNRGSLESQQSLLVKSMLQHQGTIEQQKNQLDSQSNQLQILRKQILKRDLATDGVLILLSLRFSQIMKGYLNSLDLLAPNYKHQIWIKWILSFPIFILTFKYLRHVAALLSLHSRMDSPFHVLFQALGFITDRKFD